MKNGKFKRFMAMVSCVLCMSLFTANVFAATNDAVSDSNEAHVYGVDVENSGEPGQLLTSRAIAECGSGSHDMRAKGWGDIVNVVTGKTVVNNGSCSQCSKCYLVIVTQGEPGTGKALGYYTTWQPHEKLTSYVTVIRQSGKNIWYTSKSTIPGISFRY